MVESKLTKIKESIVNTSTNPNIYKSFAKLIVSIILITTIILVWAYLLILSTIPYVKSENANQNVIWNPLELFCEQDGTNLSTSGLSLAGDSVSVGAGLIELLLPVSPDLINEGEDALVDAINDCEGDRVSYRCGDYSSDGMCTSYQTYDQEKQFCDENLNTSSNTFNQKLQENCCQDIEYNSRLNYMGLLIYSIVSIPIVYLLIEKIFEVFIRSNNSKTYSSQYRDFFAWISGSWKYLLLYLVFYYLFLPVFRFIFVSIKCDSEVFSRNSICGKRCSSDENCSSLHGECSECINGLCNNPDFRDEISNIDVRDINIKACIPSGANLPKLLYGQEIVFEDTSRPFTSRFLEPIDQDNSLHGYVPFTPNSENSSCIGKTETSCKLDIDCEWDDDTCRNFCSNGVKYDVGSSLQGELILQETDIDMDVSNRVYLNGSIAGENNFPCVDTVIPSYSRNILDQYISDSPVVSGNPNESSIKSNVNEYELNRITCSEHGSLCYMKNYPCKTGNGEAIPLKYIESGSQDLTIGEFSDEGCRLAMYPCTNYEGGNCVALSEDSEGNLIETNTGTCMRVSWNDGTQMWENDETSDEYKCVPAGLSLENTETIISDAESTDVNQAQCTSLERYPQSNYQGDQAIFRWAPTIDSTELLCENIEDSPCSESQVLSTGLQFYTEGNETDCCLFNPITGGEHDMALSGEDVPSTPIDSVDPITIDD